MPPAIPAATYRLQLTKDFGFDDAAKLAPYLARLGITHVYASPFFKARPGSTHGYDIVDHEKLNPELGGEDAFARLCAALKEHDLGLILDFVPNHMGVGHSDNAWWLDVLEWGQKSPHAASFDIDWDALPHRRHPGVLLPILGKPYGDILQAGEIEIKFDEASGSFAAWYFDHKLPINPQRYAEIIRTLVQTAGAAEEPAGQAILAVADNYRDPTSPSYSAAPEFKRQLAEISGAADLFERGLSAYRSDTESGTAALHRLLERQHYRLANWRVAFSAVNYRRFFDINDLAGLRIENQATFRATHSYVSRLIAQGCLQGLRIDHIDGLRDPSQYARRLRQLIAKSRSGTDGPKGPFYVVVEKILEEHEDLPAWPGIAGTTGYEVLNVITRVLIDGQGLAPLETTWREFTGEKTEFPAMLEAAKTRVIETMLASEFTVLAGALSRIAAGHFSTRDFTLDRLRAALQLYALEFPVYRTYVTTAGPSAHDRDMIKSVIGRARARWRGPDPEIFSFLHDAVTLDLVQHGGYSAPRIRNFALKLQQFTGPLMAKSLEDTVFYRHHRLLALNEVGGSPVAEPLSLTDFHRVSQQRVATVPHAMTATATHDTKRGEDARARILALAEMPAEWDAAVKNWRQQNAALRQQSARPQPTVAHEYMLYQALIGAWPGTVDDDFVKRMQGYALKAAREGKQETSWTNPDEAYEKALDDYIRDLLDPAKSADFLNDFGAFAARTSVIGALNGLSQLALKLLMPGVPDIYQGTEYWDLSLVDPDNRRPVDFAGRNAAAAAEAFDWPALSEKWTDGHIKQALMLTLLRLRRENPALLGQGAHEAIDVTGPHASHVIAFSRSLQGEELIVLIGRHFAPLTEGGRHWPKGWQATVPALGEADYEDLIGGSPATPDVAALFATLPVSVLRRRT